MEKTNRHICGQIHRGDVGSLISIASYAGIGEIGKSRIAPALPTDDVVYLVREYRVFFTDEAVLASAFGTQCNSSTEGPADSL
jgi:hypothetical protein